MDNKNMEKIDILYDLVKEKDESLRKRYEAIEESLFTSDMKKLMIVLADHRKTEISLSDEVSLGFVRYDAEYNIEFCLQYYERKRKQDLLLWVLPENKNYSDSFIQMLKSRIRNIKEIDTRLTFIENHMEEFVEKISEYYKEFVEKESDKLDELLAEMDYEQAPVKHLKVTVEWI